MFQRVTLISALLFAAAIASAGQTSVAVKPKPAMSPAVVTDTQLVRASPAYSELLLHKTELESTLESLLVDYNETYPKVKEIRSELALLKPEIDRLMAVKPADTGRLTISLGRLMLRKVELQSELQTLLLQYKDEHPDIRKLKRKIEVFEAAIKEILG
jgi:peptidoglycan hydrolase CwlO-like protein